MQFSKWVTIVFGALCLVAVAGVLGAPQLYYMAAILLTLPFVSWVLGWYALRGLTFERRAPAVGWEREEIVLAYIARNPTPIARFFLSIHENVPDWFKPSESGEPLFNVGGSETVVVEHRHVLARRGVYEADSFSVTAMDPLGVFGFTRRIATPVELLVYPMPRELPDLIVSGSDAFGFQEYTFLALHGSSVDPDGVRLYTPGDPLRRVHWRQTAKTGRLTVIEYDETQSLDLILAIDTLKGTDVGADNDTTLEYAIRVAASLCDAASSCGASVRLIAQCDSLSERGQGAVIAAGRRGRGDVQSTRVLAALARLESGSTTRLAALLDSHRGDVQHGSSLFVLTSKPDPELARVLTEFAGLGTRPAVVFVNAETFAGGRGMVRPDVVASFESEVRSAGIPMFVVSHEANGDLAAGAGTDANIEQLHAAGAERRAS